MKLSTWLLIAVMVAGTASVPSAQEVHDGKITVYGKVRTFAKTDRAKVVFNVKGVGKSLGAAFEDARIKIDSIAIRLYEIGLSEENLSTSFFQSSENYGDKAFLSSKRDYRVLMTATITTDRIDLLESVVVILSEGDIEKIERITFDMVNMAELRQEALTKAVEKARQKAEIVCAQLGVQCGRVSAFEELKTKDVVAQGPGMYGHNAPFNVPMYYDYEITVSGIDSRIFPQEFALDTEVRVVFEIDGQEEEIVPSSEG
jgi:uncharacterized protein YggE